MGGFALSGKTALVVEGNSGDSVTTTDGWTANSTLDYGGETYNLFEQGSFQLLLSQDIGTTGIM